MLFFCRHYAHGTLKAKTTSNLICFAQLLVSLDRLLHFVRVQSAIPSQKAAYMA